MQRIHGLLIDAGVALPGLASVVGGEADVVLTLAGHLDAPLPPCTPLYRARGDDSSDAAVEICRDASGVVCFRYSDGTEIDVDIGARPIRIAATLGVGQELEDLAAYLYGPVFAVVLRHRCILALHASCVVIHGGAVLIAGAQGSGKSTTAAALAERGHPVLSDDLTAVTPSDSGYVAHAAFDHLRVWPESERLLASAIGALAPITPQWDKLRYPLSSGMRATEPAPLRAIYVLDGSRRHGDGVSPVLAPRDALLALVALTYGNYVSDPDSRARELAQLSDIVARVPVRAVFAYEHMPLAAICDAVEEPS